jgi:type I restriction enzyme, S subunit
VQKHKHGSFEDMLNFAVPMPSLDEQALIVAFVQGEISRLRSLISETECAIKLLQERRTALISAAVTGKIDVRGLVEASVA